MQNVWKGLIVGGLTGARYAAGVVLDILAGASKKAVAVGEQVREHAPDAGRWLQSVTDKAGEWIQEADIPEHVPQRRSSRLTRGLSTGAGCESGVGL